VWLVHIVGRSASDAYYPSRCMHGVGSRKCLAQVQTSALLGEPTDHLMFSRSA